MINLKTIFTVVMSVMLSVITLGYAQVADNFQIYGNTSVESIKDIYISNATVKSGTGTIKAYIETTLASDVTLGSAGSSVTIAVTVTNNSEHTKVFNEVKYLEQTYTNPNITFTLDGIQTGTAIPSYIETEQNFLTFNITFHYAGSITTNPNLSSVLNFEFADIADFEEPSGGETPDPDIPGGGETPEPPVIVVGEDFEALIIAAMSEEKNSYGLNDKNKGSALINGIKHVNEPNGDMIVYSSDNLQGGHIKHFASETINTHKLDFLFAYSTDTEFILYMWRLSDLDKEGFTVGVTEITVYKQAYHYINGTWEKSTTLSGHAVTVEVENNQGDTIIAIDPTKWHVGAPHVTAQ